MPKIFLIGSIILLLISYLTYNYLSLIEYFKENTEVNKMGYKSCKRIPFRLPVEDFVRVQDVLIGSGLELYHHIGQIVEGKKKIENGVLVLFNMTTEKIEEIKIKGYPKNGFHPHGLDNYKDEYIFIINHSMEEKTGESIDIVKINKNPFSLEYEKSIRLPDSFLATLNGIAAVGKENFYFTTWYPFSFPFPNKQSFFQKYLSGYAIFLIRFFQIKLTYVYHYNRGVITKVKNSSGILNNGLTYNEKDKLLYSTDTWKNTINVFKVDEKNNTEELIKVIKSNFSIDNLFYDKDTGKIGAGIVGSINKFIELQNYLQKTGTMEGFECYDGFQEIDTRNNDTIVVQYLGKSFKAASSGIFYKNKYIISSCIDRGLFICKE